MLRCGLRHPAARQVRTRVLRRDRTSADIRGAVADAGRLGPEASPTPSPAASAPKGRPLPSVESSVGAARPASAGEFLTRVRWLPYISSAGRGLLSYRAVRTGPLDDPTHLGRRTRRPATAVWLFVENHERGVSMPSKCPKCGSDDLRLRSQNGGAYGMNSIPVGRGAKAIAALDNLICVACGYLEVYISDPATRQKIADTWDRP